MADPTWKTSSMVSPPAARASTQRWLCDVCQLAQFDDFEKACKHEETCQGKPGVEQGKAANENPSVKRTDKASGKRPKQTTLNNDKAGNSKTATAAPPPANSFFAPKRKKETSKEKNPDKQSKLHNQKAVDPFFAPRNTKSDKDSTQVDGEKRTTKTEKRLKTSSIPMKDGSIMTCSKSMSLDKQDKKRTTSKTTSSGSLTFNAETNLPAVETPQLASIFQHKSTKQIIAEQHQAEFQVKREAQRQREQERRAKRAALFGASNESKTSAVLTLGSGAGNPKPKKLPTLSNPLAILLKNQSDVPLAPRFPVPNHVWNESPENAPCIPTATEEILPPNHPLRKQSSSQPAIPMPVEDDMEWDLSCSKLDAVEDSTLSKIQVALQKVLVPPTRRVTDGSVVQTNDTRLWVDKYGMDHGGVVGSSAAKTCQQLTEYMNHWRKLRKEAVERMAERQRKRKAKFDRAMGRKPGTVHKPKRRKKKADSDDDDFLYDDDCWDDDELGQHSIPLCLLTGPPSSGKTAMVHHVAKQCMCSVVEINTTEIRSGAALKNKIEEATKSSSLATMLQSKENQAKANFFGAGAAAPKAVADSEDDSEDDDTHTLVHSVSSKRKRDESSMTIVLIDEADIVFDTDGDSGFWTALASLAKSAKSPIILTANSFPMHLNALPCHFFSLNRPTPIECATKILQICRHEGMDLDPQIRKQGLDCVHEKLSQVASACGCDLRRMINELQFFSHSCGGKAWTVKKAATEVDSTECRVNKIDRRPTILSVEPHKVPMDKHTVVTIKGKNLLLHRGENAGETTVWVGKHQCKSRILDDETMLLLCPPYSSMEEDDCKTFCSRMMKRVVPLSITCKSMGVFNSTSRVVKSETMINGVSNVGISWNLIEYVFPEEQVALDQDNESNGNIEEFELQQDDYTTGNESRIFPMSGLWVEEGEEHGIALWDGAMSGLPDSIPKMQQRIRTSQDDVGSLKMLHATAVHASNNSDATLIEDFQYGVPFLAGACKGFGFDFTQDCLQNSSDIDKLRFHENSRPPREEKLYELGWKDNCYFFGNPETYMTPLSMKLGKYANDVTDFFRGRDSVGEGSVPTPFVPVENIDSREDFDFMAHCACSSNEEDAYLSVPIPASLQSLPGFLRQHAPLAHPSALDKSLDYLDLDKERKDKMAWLKDKANYILPRGFKRTRWSYGRLGLCSRKENRDLVLEMLPMLRRIGLYEQAAELEELQKGDDATKIHQRTTRRQVKARRNHYFDRLSLILRRNEADLNSSEVGALIATDFLVYPVQK